MSSLLGPNQVSYHIISYYKKNIHHIFSDDGSNAVTEEQKVSEEQQEVPQENLAISAAEDSVGKEQTVPESSEQLQQENNALLT